MQWRSCFRQLPLPPDPALSRQDKKSQPSCFFGPVTLRENSDHTPPIHGDRCRRDTCDRNIANNIPPPAGGISLTGAQIRLRRAMINLGPPYVNSLVERKTSPLFNRRRGSLHPIDSESQYLHVPLLFVLEQHRRTSSRRIN
ncbi:hypothetical protein MRB53_036549 [Persea americana]|nr:hypothetical protein MRB53_037478 [Persea americana]KAJ8614683.1 hypothetical protein MRB53_036549 [Persea americana]